MSEAQKVIRWEKAGAPDAKPASTPEPTQETKNNVIPFPKAPQTAAPSAEPSVVEWRFEQAGSGKKPARLTSVSSGFGDLAIRCKAA